MKSLFSEIRSDWHAHGKDWTLPGFRALATYRFGVWRMGIRPKFLRAPFSLLYRFLYRRARNIYGIELPYSARIGANVVIEHQHGIVVHGNAEIGDGTCIRQGVTIGNLRPDDIFAAPRIGRNVNIGAGAKILGNIHVGDGATIGANAVVIRDVGMNTTVVGVPAKPVQSHSVNLPAQEPSD